ncbi:poly-beta-1,6-N-acetyl-D-glucosamine N-deacetylase PgaB [Polymorphobacter arshaanensis]|uniref:poly-beta-1,6-N-acetyl-D-glucosamine N-deacetylase PgaB n=1 Tax=Glacieibacterium arshaanense TaxID=2511025 RepID=UPI00140DD25D|nr:poly-beta-1,6-N-acetyl-D-glucosamine N-deacetylase PgaB [Polymorphobacter arshaanensis]
MFKTLLAALVLAFVTTAGVAAASTPPHDYIVLNYHDITATGQHTPPFDRVGVSEAHFADQLDWLAREGYHPISVQNLVDAAAGKSQLPEKAVLLTFDDGYESFYTRAYPLLKKHNFPAVAAIIGTWINGEAKPDVPGYKPVMTWAQVRELDKSGLVEIASHTYGLHNAIPSNPQGGKEAAVTTRRYDAATGRYETDAEYRTRIATGMQKSAAFLKRELGHPVRVMVWPYGEYNAIAVADAAKAGMPITMALADGKNALPNLSVIDRLILTDDPGIGQFSDIVETQRAARVQRVVHVDLDYIYDADPAQTHRNLSALVDRIRDMGVSTVYLQAYSDPDGDGNADAVYFPNRHLPMRADLFAYAATQLKTRAGVKVYAWMPMMAYKAKLPADWYVQEWHDGKAGPSQHIYTRLSPFNPKARAWVGDIYEDLAVHAIFDGVLFHDDGILSDYEDVSPAALAYGHKHWGLPTDFDKLHATPAMRLAWAKHKSEYLAEFTDELTARVRVYRPYIKTARNIYSRPILQTDAEEWYAQSLPVFLKHYDYVGIEAMPEMENATDADAWLKQLVIDVAKQPDGLAKSVFELQTVDWKTKQPVAMPVLLGQIELLKKAGAINLGYYPDNPYRDQPKLSDMKREFAVQVQP